MTDTVQHGTIEHDTVQRNAYQQTPSQTVGPFFGYALPYEGGPTIVPASRPDSIRFHGTVYDGDGAVVPDAIIEIWQANERGEIVHEQGSLERDGYTFTGFGRASVNLGGHYTFTTVKPGSVAARAPYILLAIFARGLSHHLYTRAYFPEEAAAHETDTVLGAVPAERRPTLIATADGERSYRFDIHFQGDDETVFLDFDA